MLVERPRVAVEEDAMSETASNTRPVHEAEMAVRWSDFDRFGHVSNAQYVELAQEARIRWAEDEFTSRGLGLPIFFVRHIELDYLKPIMPSPRHSVRVRTTVADVGNSSLTTRQELVDDEDRVACVVTTISVAVDAETARPRAITSQERAVICGAQPPAEEH